MSDRLVGVRLKIERAEEHRAALEPACKAWTEKQRSTVVHDYERDTGWHRFIARSVDPTPPPLMWGVILGELIHDLRSALDHTVWQLVLANNGAPDKRNQFPIFGRQPPKGVLGEWLHDVDVEPFNIIRKLQPYMKQHRKEPELLEILGSLSNTDKHQTLHPVVMLVGGLMHSGNMRTTTGTGDVTPEIRWNYSKGQPIDGAEIIAMRSIGEGGTVEMVGNPDIQAGVAFGEGTVPFGQVADIVADVRRIVGLLEPFTANR